MNDADPFPTADLEEALTGTAESNASKERTQTPKSSFLRRVLPVTAVLIFVLGLGLIVTFPILQTNWLIEELEANGARVLTAPRRMPDMIADWIDFELPEQFDRVVAVDLMRANPTDEELQALASVTDLETLSVSGEGITPAGLRALDSLPDLHMLVIVACPNLPHTAVEAFKRRHPHVKIEWRGPAFLGVETVFTQLSMHKVEPGAIIRAVEKDGPAANAGMRAGDIVKKFSGQPVNNAEQLIDAIGQFRPGDTVSVTVARQSETVPLEVTLGGWEGYLP